MGERREKKKRRRRRKEFLRRQSSAWIEEGNLEKKVVEAMAEIMHL